jgi:hypothetical protein
MHLETLPEQLQTRPGDNYQGRSQHRPGTTPSGAPGPLYVMELYREHSNTKRASFSAMVNISTMDLKSGLSKGSKCQHSVSKSLIQGSTLVGSFGLSPSITIS